MYKGLIINIFSKIIFVFCSYAIHYFLGNYLTAIEYGVVGIIITIININYIFLNNGVRQAISKNIAIGKYNVLGVIRKGFLVQIGFALLLVSINYFLSDQIALFLNDPLLGRFIKLTAIVIPFTGIYFLAIGIFNGKKMFFIEATIIIIYTLLRLTVIPYVFLLDVSPITEVILGFFTASFLTSIICILFLLAKQKHFLNQNNREIEYKVFLKSSTSYIMFFAGITLIMNLGMIIAKIFVSNGAHIGYYTGVQNFSQVGYYIISSFYIIILPIISSHYSKAEIEKAVAAIENIAMLIIVIVLPIVTFLSTSSRYLLSTFYSFEYIYAAPALSILVFGLFLIGVLITQNMIISSTEDIKFSNILIVLLLAVDIVLNLIFVRFLDITGVALATTLTAIIGNIISYIKLTRIFKFTDSKKLIKPFVINIILVPISAYTYFLLRIDNLFFLIVSYFIFYGFVELLFLKLNNINIAQLMRILKEREIKSE